MEKLLFVKGSRAKSCFQRHHMWHLKLHLPWKTAASEGSNKLLTKLFKVRVKYSHGVALLPLLLCRHRQTSCAEKFTSTWDWQHNHRWASAPRTTEERLWLHKCSFVHLLIKKYHEFKSVGWPIRFKLLLKCIKMRQTATRHTVLETHTVPGQQP